MLSSMCAEESTAGQHDASKSVNGDVIAVRQFVSWAEGEQSKCPMGEEVMSAGGGGDR